jgi:hypothetical protein
LPTERVKPSKPARVAATRRRVAGLGRAGHDDDAPVAGELAQRAAQREHRLRDGLGGLGRRADEHDAAPADAAGVLGRAPDVDVPGHEGFGERVGVGGRGVVGHDEHGAHRQRRVGGVAAQDRRAGEAQLLRELLAESAVHEPGVVVSHEFPSSSGESELRRNLFAA